MGNFIRQKYQLVVCVVAGLLQIVWLSANANHLPNAPHEEHDASDNAMLEHQFAEQRKVIAQAYSQYKSKVARVWGKEALIPSARQDVTYRDNLKQRSVIDYEQGVVTVELAVAKTASQDQAELRHKMSRAIQQTILQSPDERSIEDIAKQPEPPPSSALPLLAGLIANDDGTPFEEKDLEDFTKARLQSMELRALDGGDGNSHWIASTQFSLLPEHIQIRAERFREHIERYALDHIVPTPLVYAIIETESAFNPRARSPVPAFGLMQLVPATGAREAFKFLYDRDMVVKERHLYVPEKNIELGTAYLHILLHRYFRSIKNPESRKWLAIAAYNAGPRAVIRSVVGEYTKRKYASSFSWKMHAFNKINKMTPKQVYAFLRKHMPTNETRQYLKKVRQRMAKYTV